MPFGKWFRFVPAVALLVGVVGSNTVPAQGQAPTKPDASARASTPSTETNRVAGDQAWDRLIYVPYRNLVGALKMHGATVFLPFADYLKLWEQGAPIKPTDKPPVSAVIAESQYSARVEKDLARIDATFIVQSLGKTWSEVPLTFGEAAVGKLTAGEGVLLRATAKGAYALLLPKPGRHEVKLELLARVRTSPEGRTLELVTPPVGITTFELQIPEADQSVEMTPRLVALPVEAAAGQTRIKANLGATEKITANWHPRAGTKPEMELLTAVTNTLSISIDERIVHADASLTYQVLRGELSQLQLAVPVGHRILDISAGNVRLKGWKAAAEANRQLVTVELLSPLRGNVTLEVHTEGALPAASFDAAGIDNQGAVHGIHAVNVVRESGQLIISTVRGLTFGIEQQLGLTRIEEAEVDGGHRKPGGFYFRFYSPTFELKGTARPVEPRIVVEQNTQLVFGDDELRLTADLSYEIERAGIFDLVLKVPDDLTIDSVDAESMKGYQVDPQTKLLKISFEQKVEGNVNVNVTAHRALSDGGTQEQKLPLLEPTGVARETGTSLVYGPQGVELITDQEKVVGAHPEIQPSAGDLPQARLVSAWSYSRRPVEIPVRVVRKPTRLTARIASTIRISQELAEVTSIVDYNVEHAGIDSFRLAVPEAVADRVQIRAEGEGPEATIKQQVRDTEAIEGWVGLTVIMQQKGIGQRRLRVSYDLKPVREGAAAEGGAATNGASNAPSNIAFDPVRVLPLKDSQGNEIVPLAQIEGEVAVVKDRALSVSAEVVGTDLEAIDVRELKLLNGAATNLAYRYFKQLVGLKITSVKHDVQGVVQTVVAKGLIEVVVGRDPQSPTATYRCRYRMRSSERQRLSIDLPSGAQPLGVSIDGRQIVLEKHEAAKPAEGWDAYFVNVARSGSSEAMFLLSLQFQRPISPAPFSTRGGALQLGLPRIGGADSSNVAVQQTRVVTWIPDKYSLVGTPKDFQRESRSYLGGMGLGLLKTNVDTQEVERWIGSGTSGLIDFPTEGHAYQYTRLGPSEKIEVKWWDMPFYATVLSIAVLLVAIALVKTTWEHRLGLVLIAGLLVALYALSDRDAAMHLLVAARYGLVAMFAFWLIHALFGPHSIFRGPALAAAGAGPASAGIVVPPPSTPPPTAAPQIQPPETPKPADEGGQKPDRQEG